jgi:hypothetical protein
MSTIAAVIFTDAPDGVRRETADLGSVTVAGLTVAERTALAAHDAGVDHVHVVGQRLPDEAVLERLRRRGLHATSTRRRGSPLLVAPAVAAVIMLPSDTVVEPAALVSFIEWANLGPGGAALMIDRRPQVANRLVKVSDSRVTSLHEDGDAGSTDIAILSPEAVFMVRDAWSARQALRRLARFGILRAFDAAPHFYERLGTPADAGRTERAYLAYLNGGDNESVLTKTGVTAA